MKRLWFQFIRPASEREEAKSVPTITDCDAETVKQPKVIPIKIEGGVWVHPEALYYPSVISGYLEYQRENNSCLFKIFPTSLALEIGQIRRVDGRISRIKTSTQEILSEDLPFSLSIKSHSAFGELNVGELIVQHPDINEKVEFQETPYARGTALIRLVDLEGIIFDEQVSLHTIEISRLQLLQNDQAWLGNFFSVYEENAQGHWGNLLVNHIKAAGSGGDPLIIVRRIVQRYAKG